MQTAYISRRHRTSTALIIATAPINLRYLTKKPALSKGHRARHCPHKKGAKPDKIRPSAVSTRGAYAHVPLCFCTKIGRDFYLCPTRYQRGALVVRAAAPGDAARRRLRMARCCLGRLCGGLQLGAGALLGEGLLVDAAGGLLPSLGAPAQHHGNATNPLVCGKTNPYTHQAPL